MPKSKLDEILKRVLGIPFERIDDNTSPENTESWDSFNGLLLVSELEKAFKIKFSMEEITEVKNVGDIKKVLRKHGIDYAEF